MKIKFFHIAPAVLLILAAACKKDNYDAPTSTLRGALLYKGDSIGVEYNQVPFNVFQPGYGKSGGAITGTFAPDGTYSILVFDGNYQFTMPKNQGPFLWKELTASARDTLKVGLQGSQTVNIEVTPYYMVRNQQLTVSGGKVVAAFDIEKVITDAALAKNIQTVVLYINKTKFVSGASNDNIASASVAGTALPADLKNISLNVTIPAISPTQNYVFARVGVRITGVEDMIFSPLKKLTF
ncbi:DUF3823 domain-containing protein [Hufsiella ginkgonis]|uniref:DUF3823 domain-containing protein n=1 Tax=Hufsiella ginkgonis TaxID=2695274 RepID=A0A7K1XZX6_9SPHI|nr:DUF3823 domain-containing protein [Hufsiella ginkgonis]MXV16367.1 DUF3823 domain-containing protein [Hufsiella ginkgonis]